MKTKSIPALIMLTAGFVACVIGIVNNLEFFPFVKILLLVLIVFYVLGCIVKTVLDRSFKEEEKEETTEGNEQALDGEETAEAAGTKDEKPENNNGGKEK